MGRTLIFGVLSIVSEIHVQILFFKVIQLQTQISFQWVGIYFSLNFIKVEKNITDIR